MTAREAEKYMRAALDLAKKGEGRTSPNPMVGAVIVSSGKIIAKGYHLKAGFPHAEAMAIKNLKRARRGSVMFVNLEPCDHYGRTPPCTEAIIKSGITKIYIAMKDPNRINSGRGIRKLRQAGIDVHVGICGEEAAFINRAYVKFITRGIPYLTVKLAQSLDGKTAAFDGTSKWISSANSRRYVKKLRSSMDAVMVGVNTVLKDDPTLLAQNRSGKKVARIVLDSKCRIPEDSRLVATAKKAPLILVTTSSAPVKRTARIARKEGVDVVFAKSRKGRVDLKDLMFRMAERGIVSIMSEGGGELAGALVDGGLADEFIFFIAPKILGGKRTSIAGKGAGSINEALILNDLEFHFSGRDIVVRARVPEKQKGK
jgi:diaminohydroxyphosphoribosylaminopyrimidine deaminase / 5-amino-6-(5-phosphoribosylamino)uracil reductase